MTEPVQVPTPTPPPLRTTIEPITAEDLRVCCDPHNQEHARQAFGDAYISQFHWRGRRRTPARRGDGGSSFAA